MLCCAKADLDLTQPIASAAALTRQVDLPVGTTGMRRVDQACRSADCRSASLLPRCTSRWPRVEDGQGRWHHRAVGSPAVPHIFAMGHLITELFVREKAKARPARRGAPVSQTFCSLLAQISSTAELTNKQSQGICRDKGIPAANKVGDCQILTRSSAIHRGQHLTADSQCSSVQHAACQGGQSLPQSAEPRGQPPARQHVNTNEPPGPLLPPMRPSAAGSRVHWDFTSDASKQPAARHSKTQNWPCKMHRCLHCRCEALW